MESVNAGKKSRGVSHRCGRPTARCEGSDDQAVESETAGPTRGPRDGDGTARAMPPVVRLVPESAERFAEVVTGSYAADDDEIASGTRVDVYA